MGLVKFSAILFVIFIAITTVARVSTAKTRMIEVDGWCLKFEEDSVEYASRNPWSRIVSPFFLVPWDEPTSERTDDPERLGLFIRFWKRDAGRMTNIFERRRSPRPGMCLEEPSDFGLNRLMRDPNLADPARTSHLCPVGEDRERYVPTTISSAVGAVRIDCVHYQAIGSCSMVQTLESGWEITTTLPKTQLSRWSEAAIATKTFFETNFTDCEQ